MVYLPKLENSQTPVTMQLPRHMAIAADCNKTCEDLESKPVSADWVWLHAQERRITSFLAL